MITLTLRIELLQKIKKSVTSASTFARSGTNSFDIRFFYFKIWILHLATKIDRKVANLRCRRGILIRHPLSRIVYQNREDIIGLWSTGPFSEVSVDRGKRWQTPLSTWTVSFWGPTRGKLVGFSHFQKYKKFRICSDTHSIVQMIVSKLRFFIQIRDQYPNRHLLSRRFCRSDSGHGKSTCSPRINCILILRNDRTRGATRQTGCATMGVIKENSDTI